MIELANFILLLLIGLGHDISVWWVFGLLCVKICIEIIAGITKKLTE